jgi:alpha-tubulin suppressor-like RCC1 family protein
MACAGATVARGASIRRPFLKLLVLGWLVALATAAPAHAEMSAAGWGYNGKGELGAGYSGKASPVPLALSGVVGIKELQVAGEWSAALLTDGTVRAWGGNHLGQLGDGTNLTKINPVTVRLQGPAVQIATAPEHAIALLANGAVETWGSNVDGEMGNGTTGTGKESCIQPTLCFTPTPSLVPGLTGVVAVDAGGADDVALLANGTVLAWGENRKGQLGDGTTVRKSLPTQVRALASVKQVVIGANATLGGHMLALLNNGTVAAIGEGGQGQLGNGTIGDSLTPVQVKGLTGVVHVAASYTHSLALLGSGQLFAWGTNSHGATGTRTTAICGRLPCVPLPALVPLKAVSSASAGFNFSVAVSGGNAYSWGQDSYGKLGDGSLADRGTPGLVSGLSGVVEVVAGETHGFARVADPGPASAAPGIGVVASTRSLTVNWQAASNSDSWQISYRPKTNPRGVFSTRTVLASAARSYTISALEPRPYEVLVQQSQQGPFGRRIVEGTPTA